MEPLAGWTIAVTAERRADEQAQMLEARGARVLRSPTVASSPLGHDLLRERTAALIASPPAMVIANTATGVRSWIALAWSWGMGDDLLRVLGETRLVARGTKAAGALMSEGLDVEWIAPTETLADVYRHVTAERPRGSVVLQCDGRGPGTVADALRLSGVELVELPVYQVAPVDPAAESSRRSVPFDLSGVDAITFTSPAAVDGFVRLDAQVPSSLDRATIPCCCVGPVTAAAAAAAGFANLVVPGRARLGPMVRALADHMATMARSFELVGCSARLQGSCLDAGVIGSRSVSLTPRERMLIEALVDARGAVVSKAVLARTAWDGDVDEHTVEVTVNRLRRKLGSASAALETSNRRGYRLATGPVARFEASGS